MLLVRRSISKPSELAYYICHTSTPVPVAELVRIAGSRWGVEETFQFAKNETGLDHYQVRKYDAWYRHITLSMLAATFLAEKSGASLGKPRFSWSAHAERIRDHTLKKGHSQPTTSILRALHGGLFISYVGKCPRARTARR
ncbi:transposase [Saccharopolyspora karakumensis]|uniref:transposase n=1 Tax=Saccharopolyspora karakumensis TaxID=2530386 RepID=UPI0026D55107